MCLLVVCLLYQDVNLMKARPRFLYWYFLCIVLPTLFQVCPHTPPWKVVSTNICQRKDGRRKGSEGHRGLYSHLVGLQAFCFSLLPSLLPWPVQSLGSHLTLRQPPCLRPAPSHSSTHKATEHLFKTQELLPVKPLLNVQKKIFAKHIPDKGCMPRIYKGLSKLNRRK